MSIPFLPASRSITAVKVDHSPIGTVRPMARFTLSWLDGAGDAQRIERHGYAAHEFVTDLLACTLVSEAARTAYLIGFIRCHALRRDGEG